MAGEKTSWDESFEANKARAEEKRPGQAEFDKLQQRMKELQAEVDSFFNEDDAPTLGLTLREMTLMHNCQVYAAGDMGGLPGHNLMVVVAKLADHIEFQP